MSLGSYGIVRPADVSPSDVDIFYTYSPSRDFGNQSTLDKLTASASDILIPQYNNTNTGAPVNGIELFGGMYTLKLEASVFSTKGIYNIVIKPKEMRTKLVDCGVLSALPNVKGIVVDTADPGLAAFTDKMVNGGLVGYRVEYLNDNGTKIQNFYRVITSANRCEPVNQNLTNTSQTAVRYRFNDSGSLLFLTVTPSSAPNVKPNAVPFIGTRNQSVVITNTFFNPIMLEVDMVEYDASTLAYGLYGPQTKSMEDGIYTIYDFDKNIYKQYNLFEIKDEFDETLYEIREPRTTIDFGKGFDTISTPT
tara:strand:+ start:3995 stop:4915 length:921 start_codon:yes stop_codon:yes gene_type:complete